MKLRSLFLSCAILGVCLFFCTVGDFCRAADKYPDALDPPLILKPIPEKYGDEHRMFQGIASIGISPGGRLWAAWYTGGDNEGGENYVVLVTSGDRGETWSKPLLAVDVPGPVRTYDPALWLDPDGKLWFFWAQSKGWWDGRSGVWCMTSDNADREDAAWSPPRRLCDGIMMCKPTADSKGRWLFPVAVWNRDPIHPETTLPTGANVMLSEDRGKTFRLLGNASVPKNDAIFDEHMIVERKDGSLWMLIRTKSGMAESTSTDGGTTWSETKSAYPHTSSRFFIRRLNSGRLLFVKHGRIDQKTGRSHLTAYLSDDDGKTWQGGFLLDERDNISYPDGVEYPDGTLCIIYDWERYKDKEILVARLTEEDILAGKIVSPQGKLRIPVNKAFGVIPPPKPEIPLQFTPNANTDGKPFRAEPAARLELSDEFSSQKFQAGEKLFTDRNYTVKDFPKMLEGKRFVRGSIEKTEATVLSDGMVYVLTPQRSRNKDSVTEYLSQNGFEKVAHPETLLFGNIVGNITTLYQKDAKKGDQIRYGKWGILVY